MHVCGQFTSGRSLRNECVTFMFSLSASAATQYIYDCYSTTYKTFLPFLKRLPGNTLKMSQWCIFVLQSVTSGRKNEVKHECLASELQPYNGGEVNVFENPRIPCFSRKYCKRILLYNLLPPPQSERVRIL